MKLSILLLFIVLIVLLVSKYILTSTRSVEMISNFPNGYEIASWLWASPDELSPSKVADLLDFAKEEGISVIYLNIANYVDISELEDKNLRSAKKEKFEESVSFFIAEATKRNIKVQALGGDYNWASPDYAYIPKLLLNYVFEFNKANPSTSFSGINYDIEFYNQPDFATNTQMRTTEYLTLVKSLSVLSQQSAQPLNIGFSLTYWLDNDNGNLKVIKWNGTEKYPIFHILDELSRFNNTYITIMAYRNKALGVGGSADLVTNELSYLKKNNYTTPLFLGQETDLVLPTNITFYGTSKKYFKSEITAITTAFKSYGNLKGFAINQLVSYQSMAN
jgi:hypothetical protein